MPENFDPYRKWLGIPPEEQPPHHYRLLGVGTFEADGDVIQEAADRQMAHVQTHKMGRYSELSQKLLNELATAKLTLLNAQRKAAYDNALRAKIAAAKAPRTAVPLQEGNGPAAPPPVAAQVAGQIPARPAPGRAAPPLPPVRPVASVAPVAAAATEIEQDFVGTATRSRRARQASKRRVSPLYLAAGGVMLVMIGIIVVLARGLNENDNGTPDKVASVDPNDGDPTGTSSQENKGVNKSSQNDTKPGDTAPDDGKSNTGGEAEQPVDANQSGDPASDGDPAQPEKHTVGVPNEVVTPAHVSPEMVGLLQGHPGAVSCSAISPNGKRAVTAGREGGLRVWDVDRRQELRQIPLQSEFANALAFFGDNVRVAVAGHDGYVRVIDTNNGNEVRAWGGIRLPMMSVAVTPDNRYVVAGGHEKVVRVWDATSGKEINRWAGFKDHIYAVAITPDGRRILAASGGYWPSGKLTSAEDHTLHMVDLKTKQESKFTGHKGGIWCISVSGNGQRAATASYDGTVRIWNLLSGTLLQVLDPFKQAPTRPIIWSCAFSRDGRLVLSGGDDGMVRVWDSLSGGQVKQLAGATRSITGLSISADGRTALSSGAESVARLWNLRQGVEVAVKPTNPKPPGDGAPQETPSETTDDDPDGKNGANKTPADDAAPRVSLAELFGEAKPAGDPVPEPAERQQAIKLIKEIFQDDYKAAKKPADKLALAEKLLEQAASSQNATERFALMSEARDRARDAGNSTLVIEVYEKLAGQFAIDPLDEMVKTFDQMQKETGPPATKKELAENLLPLSDRAVAAQKYATAHKLLSIAQLAALKTADKQLPKQIAARDAEVVEARKRFDAAKTAYDTLAKTPDDAAANLLLGKFLCFDKDDWIDGLPLLAKGGDENLARLAAQDAANPAGHEEQVKLADVWFAAEGADAKDKPKYLARAEKWYQTALPNVPAGLTKKKVENRLEELAAVAPRPATGTKTPAEVASSERPSTVSSAGATNATMAKSLAARVKQAMRKNALVFSPLVGGASGNPYQEVPAAGMLLVGFNYTLNEYDNISSLQPIYQTSKGVVTGTAYGYVNGPPQSIVAKKGYAVSSVQAQGSYYMYGMQVDFMKVDKATLDSTDKYSSDWVGHKYSGGYRIVVLGGDGNPIIGVYGKTTSQQVASLGVIQLPAEKSDK